MNNSILAAVALATLCLGAGWTGQADRAPFVPPTQCQPAAVMSKSTTGMPEVQGKATNADVWALFFHPARPFTANQKVKIVWRMTGTGKFTVAAYSPSGRRVDPESGPDSHSSSTWTHDGDEWGTWFIFPASGCWDLHVSRAGSAGDVWVDVD
jgi:hypothetical protein